MGDLHPWVHIPPVSKNIDALGNNPSSTACCKGLGIRNFTQQGCCTKLNTRIPLQNFVQFQHQNLQLLEMIDGVHAEEIQPSDHYRRFIVLKILLRKALSTGGEQNQRYLAIQQDLQKLEELVAFKNVNNATKATDTLARMDQLNTKMQEVIPKVQASKSMFEGELLKRWRNTLNVKQKKEEQLQKQKEEKSTSNKNLMYLSAEILKKERLSAHNLRDHKQRINVLQQKIQEAINESTNDFRARHTQLRKAIYSEKDKIKMLIEKEQTQMQAQQQQFLQSIKQAHLSFQNQLQQQQQASSLNFSQIKNLLKECA